MINDYKGEMPKNVITEEEHRKRPFYKKVSFWVLSALGLFFGGCSVYGLVLGYQYVHAVTEAAHIIADANGSEENNDVSLKPKKNNLATPSGSPDHFTFSNHFVGGWTGDAFFRIDTGANVLYNQLPTYIPVWRINIGADYTRANLVFPLSSSGYTTISPVDYIKGYQTNASASWWTPTLNYPISAQQPLDFSGEFYYYPSTQFYDDGYQEGYADGSDAINLPQSVKVLLPVGNEYSVQFKSYVDGVVDRQGQLNSSQTGGAYATFDRSRTQKLRIDLTLPSGSRAFFLYTPSWTTAYPSDENYSLRQSWAVSGVTYLPTWISKPQIYVGVTSADVPDLTYETISVAFDVDHWGDIKVGAYSQGYNDGYQAGEENPTAYDSGYDAGYEQGYDDGHTLGVAQGESQAVSGQKALVNMFVTAFQQPFDQIYRFLNFNVLGLNILALFTALLTLSIGIIIIKKVI